jgi:hypothetical protein
MPWLNQLVSNWPLTMEAWVYVWVSPCGICGGQSGTGTRFSSSSSVFPHQYHSSMALNTHISSTGWTTGLLITTDHRHSLTPSTWTTTTMIVIQAEVSVMLCIIMQWHVWWLPCGWLLLEECKTLLDECPLITLLLPLTLFCFSPFPSGCLLPIERIPVPILTYALKTEVTHNSKMLVTAYKSV